MKILHVYFGCDNKYTYQRNFQLAVVRLVVSSDIFNQLQILQINNGDKEAKKEAIIGWNKV